MIKAMKGKEVRKEVIHKKQQGRKKFTIIDKRTCLQNFQGRASGFPIWYFGWGADFLLQIEMGGEGG